MSPSIDLSLSILINNINDIIKHINIINLKLFGYLVKLISKDRIQQWKIKNLTEH